MDGGHRCRHRYIDRHIDKIVNTVKTIIVIPARYGSSRLPGKPLADINGKPMIQHVVERAQQVGGVNAVIVATDDQRVEQAVKRFGGQVMLTADNHPSGTDRLVEVMQHHPADVYINVQGDEPLVRPDDLTKLATVMADTDIPVATLCHSITANEETSPNAVKVVLNHQDDALYFSRSPIPYPRNGETAHYLKHVGVYAYRREILERYSQLPQPMTEQSELLEQLRLLHAGIAIRMVEVEPTGPGVDTPECLEKVRAIMAGESPPPPAPKPDLSKIKLVITDVDGVLTDGGLFYDENGECLKRFHARDGLGTRMLEENGIRVAILSGRDSATLRKRIKDLKLSLFQLGIQNKAKSCQELMEQASVSPHETLFVGDDSIDLPAFSACGLTCTVADAPDYIKDQSDIVLNNRGGDGAFRELADKILATQDKADVYETCEGFQKIMNKAQQ